MLRITIELVPFGDEDEKEILSQFLIWNTGYKEGRDTVYKIARSLNSPAVIFHHNRAESAEKCVMLGIQAARQKGLDKF